MLQNIHSILNLFFRLQEEYEKSKEGETIRYSSDGEDLFEKIKYHQELVDLERKVNLKMVIYNWCLSLNYIILIILEILLLGNKINLNNNNNR